MLCDCDDCDRDGSLLAVAIRTLDGGAFAIALTGVKEASVAHAKRAISERRAGAGSTFLPVRRGLGRRAAGPCALLDEHSILLCSWARYTHQRGIYIPGVQSAAVVGAWLREEDIVPNHAGACPC